jgi:hypothetical protein
MQDQEMGDSIGAKSGPHGGKNPEERFIIRN